jgi:hypothetical protein
MRYAAGSERNGSGLGHRGLSRSFEEDQMFPKLFGASVLKIVTHARYRWPQNKLES